MKRDLRYGGTLCDAKELAAITASVRKSIKTGNWQAGEEAKQFEKELADYIGVKHAVLTTSGSCAGLLALSALELPKGSEVIISACTFPTIFNIILQRGLVPVVVDAKIGTYQFDLKEVEEAITANTKAIIAIHPLGNPVNMPQLMKLAKKHNLYVIEDNCDGLGSRIGDKRVGSFGHFSITSLHAAHIVSMGVGGVVFTNDNYLANTVRMYRDWGRQANLSQKKNGKKWKELPEDYDSRFIYEKIGYNFQILDLQAAMGRVQLKKIEKIKQLRKCNFDYLYKHLSKHQLLILPQWHWDADICWFAFPITYNGDRGKLIDHLEKHGVETRSMFSGDITKHPAYKNSLYRFSILDGANVILHHSFWITVNPRLTTSDLQYMVKVFDDFFS